MKKRQCGRCGYEIDPKDDHYNKKEKQYECALCVDEQCMQYMSDNREIIFGWVFENIYQKFYQKGYDLDTPSVRDNAENREKTFKTIGKKLKRLAVD